MRRFCLLWWLRTVEYIQGHMDFLSAFLEDRWEIYQFRWTYYRFADWHGLFWRTWLFGLYVGLLRLVLYSMALALGLAVIPFRLLVEFSVTSPKGRRILLFFLDWVGSGFGLLWLGSLRERFEDFLLTKGKQLLAFLEDNPVYALAQLIERWDRKTDVYEERLRTWIKVKVLKPLPIYYKALRYKWGVRRRYLRQYFQQPVWKNYRRRTRSRYASKLYEGRENVPAMFFSKVLQFFWKAPHVLSYGFFAFLLFLRTVVRMFRPFLWGFRCRRPKRGHRLKIRRNWWD